MSVWEGRLKHGVTFHGSDSHGLGWVCGASNHNVAQGAAHGTTARSSMQASAIHSSYFPPSSLEDKTVQALSHPCPTTRRRRKSDLLLKKYVRSSVPASRNTGPARYTSLLLLIYQKRPNEAMVPPEDSTGPLGSLTQ